MNWFIITVIGIGRNTDFIEKLTFMKHRISKF